MGTGPAFADLCFKCRSHWDRRAGKDYRESGGCAQGRQHAPGQLVRGACLLQ